MVCRSQSVNLFFACVNRSRRGKQPVLDLDFACVDCNRVSAEQQIEAEPIKEEPENPPGKSTKSKKLKAVLSQNAIQKFVEEKQKTLKNARKNLNSEFAEFVEGAALHESPKDAADFSLIREASGCLVKSLQKLIQINEDRQQTQMILQQQKYQISKGNAETVCTNTKVNAHELKLLYNQHLQWCFVNARAEVLLRHSN